MGEGLYFVFGKRGACRCSSPCVCSFGVFPFRYSPVLLKWRSCSGVDMSMFIPHLEREREIVKGS